MKIQIQIFLSIFIATCSSFYVTQNPYQNNSYQDFVDQYYGVLPADQDDFAEASDNFSYRGYNTYNFNNYVPLHYGLFDEEEVKQAIDQSTFDYKNEIENSPLDPQISRRARRYKRRFNRRNPITYADWYGLSRYYPGGYNSYRLF